LQIACIFGFAFLDALWGSNTLPALCASSGLRRGQKHSADKNIGRDIDRIGFVLLASKNG
jgi:hypothetical protein